MVVKSIWLAFMFQEKDITLSGEHVREGLTCVISVKVPNPEFEGQTKVCYFIMVLILVGALLVLLL